MSKKQAKKGSLRFQEPSGRPVLSREEYHYLAAHLPKVLKISTEFEQNLPSPKAKMGQKKDGECVNLASGCSTSGCVHLESCMLQPHPSLCKTRSSGQYLGDAFACPAKSDSDVQACSKCPSWQLDCRKTACAMFVPFCSICPSFKRADAGVEGADIRLDSEAIREEMKHRLMPTGFVGEVGSHGVLEVKKDDSLKTDGGVEIPTVGRRFHYASFYKMCKDIIDPLLERGAYVDERCGQHFHILAGYLPAEPGMRAISELEKPMPEIVLANLHQLHRRYELAMFWMMSAGNNREYLTRWARFRQSIYPFSALRARMSKVVQELADTIICKNGAPKDGKYGAIAYYFSRFNDKGDITTFHLENRIADGAQSPSVITAWAALCVALVMKAVRCSQYGILEVGTREYVENVKRIQPRLIDGGTREWGENRRANTSHLSSQDIQFLRESSHEMVNFLKPELSDMGPAYSLLESLAENPCSIRLCAGDTWSKIEQDLLALAPGYPTGDLAAHVQEIIDLSGVTDCESIEEWVAEVANRLGSSAPEISDTVTQLINHDLCRWSNPLGAVIAL